MKSDVKKFLEYKFETIKLLHKSDKSEIYLAQFRADKKLVVIKFLKSVGLPYNALKKISHKILPKIFYYAEDSTDSVVVEEFLQGESLAERKNFISTELAQKILLQMCDGLKVLHENKIIHRDIKPSNLILQNDEIIRLIDFDAARIFDSDKKHDTHYFGTKGYAPPEQFGYGQTDSRSDIFSLGITIFELLGDNCDNRLKKILSKCTELDPKNRWQSVDELKSALLEKKSSHKRFFASLLLIILILSFANSTSDEKIPLPTEIKISEPEVVEEISVEERTPQKKFEFPEIKLPQENITQQNFDLPKISMPEINSSPQKNIPAEKIPEPAEVTPTKNYVKVKYWLNNTRSAEWTDNFETDTTNAVDGLSISENAWSKWRSADGGAIIFPDYKIYIEAQNFSANTFTNPQINLVYNDNGRVETKTYNHASSIAPAGGKINFTIPLGNFRVDNPRVAGDTWRTFNTITIYFSGSGAEIIGSKMQYDFTFVSQKRKR